MKKFKIALRTSWLLCVTAVIACAVIGFSACIFGQGVDTDSTGGGSKQDNNNYIGDTVTSDSLSFKVTVVSNESLLGSELVGAATENNFILVTTVIKNEGDSEKNITSSYVTLFKGSAKYEPHTGGIYIENGFYALETIGSGITKTVTFVFETPTKSNEDEYVLQVKGSSFATVQKIILKEKA